MFQSLDAFLELNHDNMFNYSVTYISEQFLTLDASYDKFTFNLRSFFKINTLKNFSECDSVRKIYLSYSRTTLSKLIVSVTTENKYTKSIFGSHKIKIEHKFYKRI